MGKGSAPDSPDPVALIKAQTDANRVNQYTPYGNLLYGKFDENGNLIPNNERESSVQTQRPQDQTFQNYTDGGRLAMLQNLFGNFTPAANTSSTASTGSATTTPTADNGLVATMAKPATESATPATKQYTYDELYAPGGTLRRKDSNSLWQAQQEAANQPAATTTTTAAQPNPYGNNQGGGIGTFDNFSMAKAGDPKAIARGLSGWGDPNSLKSGLTDFYNLNGIKGSLPGVSSDFSNDRMRAEESAYNRATSKFEPDFAERRKRLEQRLADTGNVMGSEGYSTEMDRLGRSENEAYTNAGYDAVNAGTSMYDTMQRNALATRGQLFGEDTSLAQLTAGQRGQQYGENQGVFNAQNSLRAQQLAEGLSQFGADNTANTQQFSQLASLLGMQSPQAQYTNVPQVDAAGIMNQDYQNQLGAYNTQMSGLGSLLGVGGQLGAAAIKSDIRLKENIRKVGDVDGINIYEFSYIGEPGLYRGVMAQEVEHIPGAVVEHPDGYKMVDYSKIGIPFERLN